MSNQLAEWNPIRDLIQMREALDRAFERRTSYAHDGKTCYRLPIDAYSTDDTVVIEAAIPGADPDEVDISINGDSLTIRAEIKFGDIEGRNYLIHERSYGLFERSLTLNVPVEVDKVTAEFANGVLTLTLPKAESVKPRKITVKAAK